MNEENIRGLYDTVRKLSSTYETFKKCIIDTKRRLGGQTPGAWAGPGSSGLASHSRPLCGQRKITARHVCRNLSDVISGERHVFPCHCGQMTRACGVFKIS